jgi:hypothetical protein
MYGVLDVLCTIRRMPPPPPPTCKKPLTESSPHRPLQFLDRSSSCSDACVLTSVCMCFPSGFAHSALAERPTRVMVPVECGVGEVVGVCVGGCGRRLERRGGCV